MSSDDVWFAYGQVNFNRRVVQWVLENAVAFQRGSWPKRVNTGYIDFPFGSHGVKHEGHFVKAALVWAEVEARLKQCGDDGLDCLSYYLGESTVAVMARKARVPEERIWGGINRAIRYAGSGRCRRWVPCPEDCQYRAEGHCMRKNKDGWDYAEWRRRMRQ